MSVAIIGTGFMGATQATAWSEVLGPTGLTYLVGRAESSPVPDGLEHIPFTVDYERVLQDPATEIVVICTPTDTHRSLAERALAAGKHVLLEKPIALSREDAAQLRSYAQDSASVLVVGHVVRCFKGYELLARDVEDGVLGQILSIRAKRDVARPARGRPIYDPEVSGGVLVDLGVHDFDQIAKYLGRPVTVRAFGNATFGPVETVLEFAEGAVATVGTSLSASSCFAFGSAIEIHGTKGIARYEMLQQKSTTKLAPGAGETTSSYRRVAESGSVHHDLPTEKPFVEQARRFLELVRAGTGTDADALQSAEIALEIALAARDSLSSQREPGL